MRVYHGTTKDQVVRISRLGLLPGSWVSQDRAVAEHFAVSRSEHVSQPAVVLVFVVTKRILTRERRDRSGRVEQQTKTRLEIDWHLQAKETV